MKNKGFDGRMFLTEAEYNTYCRRLPVRFIKKQKDIICCICEKPTLYDNPLWNAHVISFNMGIVEFGLTPDFLDSDDNIKTAHRRTCNKSAELDFHASMMRLKSMKVETLPNYLPDTTRELWDKIIIQSE